MDLQVKIYLDLLTPPDLLKPERKIRGNKLELSKYYESIYFLKLCEICDGTLKRYLYDNNRS